MEPLSFVDITKAEHFKRDIAVRVTVSGKSLVPYGVPREILVQCTTARCDCDYKVSKSLTIQGDDENILKFIDKPENHFQNIVKKIFGIRCQYINFQVVSIQNVERIYICEIIGKDKSRDNTIKTAFYVGHGIDSNTPYLLCGYQAVDPKDQTITWVFTEAEKVHTDVDSFNISKHMSDLRAFQVNSNDPRTLMHRLQLWYGVYARNITEIYHRFDLHLAVDLVFRSVLSFNFGKENVKKGWLDVMLLGDPRSGKGYVAEGLLDYFGFGEVCSTENASYAGLVAGLQQLSRHWIVTWGKIPVNDKGLLVVDEAGNLGEDWAKLSRIRSEGIAEITKIHTQLTMARTRLIWLSNPIKKVISDFPYGVQALNDVIASPEDIARFDFAFIAAHEEIDIEKINERKPMVKWYFDQELERDLIRWTWSRTHEQIHFTDEAIDEIYKTAILMGNMFDFTIPLVQGENVRLKLAKVAVALACRFFSTDKTGQLVVVRKVHVQTAFTVFWGFYSKTAHGYLSYSKLKKQQSIKEEAFDRIKVYIGTYKLQEESIYRWLLGIVRIDARDLQEYLGLPPGTSSELLGLLIRYNCIAKKGGSYMKTAGFNQWLRKQVWGDVPMHEDTME